MPNQELKSIDDYEVFLTERMTPWSPPQRVALAAAIAEHWLPAYESFSAEKEWGDPASLRRNLEEEQQLFEAALTDELLAAPRRVRDNEYTLGELVQHLLNHSTYHRGQVAFLLRQLGQSPPATDYRLFLTEAH